MLLLAGAVLRAAPANDDFTDRIPLTGTPASGEGTNVAATFEDGEPDINSGWVKNTVWWSWTAPQSGPHWISLAGSSFTPRGPELAVFRGDTLRTLTALANVSHGNYTLQAEAGVTYHLRAGGGSGAEGRIRITVIPAPANDNFAARAALTGHQAKATAFNHLATAEPGQPEEWHGVHTLWWTWTAPDAGVAEVSLFDSESARMAGVYTGATLAALRPVAGAAFHSAMAPLKWRAVKGQSYQIAVGSWPWDPPGQIALELNLFPTPPANDSSSRPVRVEGVDAWYAGALFGATRQSGESRVGPADGLMPAAGRTTWHVWRPAYSGHAAVAVTGRGFAPLLSVYQGSSRLADAGSEATQPTNTAAALFEVTAGRDYGIQVDAVGHATDPLSGGAYRLELALWTLRLAQPRPDAVVTAPAPILLAVSPPNPAVDGQLASVAYLSTHELQSTAVVAGGAGPDFAAAFTNLPPGEHAVVAFATNTAGRAVVSLPVKVTVRPPNDAFAAATLFTGYHVSNAVSFRAATRQAAEPAHALSGAGTTLWYRWTPPATGMAEVTTGAAAAMYRGKELTSLARIQSQPGPAGSVMFAVEEDTTYHLVLERRLSRPDWPWPDPWETDLSVQLRTLRLASPADATYWTDATGVRLEAVTTERPDRAGTVDFIANGAVVATAAVAGGQAAARWTEMPAGEYAIQARMHLPGGETQLTPVQRARISPANDEFARPRSLADSTGQVRINLYATGREADEPQHPFDSTAGTVWWRFTAPADGLFRVTTLSTPHLGGLAAYTGDRITGLRQLPWEHFNNFSDGGRIGRYAVLTNGQTIALVAGAAQSGGVAFDWRFAESPENDHFAKAAVLPASRPEVLDAELNGATVEPTEGNLPAATLLRASRWWRFEVPGPGAVGLEAFGGLTGAWVSAYAGEDLESLSLLGGSMPWAGEPRFARTQAGPVWLALNHAGGADERGGFRVIFEPVSPNDAFRDRVSVSGGMFGIGGQPAGASREGGEPVLAGAAGSTLWWTWTPSDNGLLSIEGPWAAVGVYRGNELASLVPLTTKAIGVPQVATRVVAGETLQIQLDAASSLDGLARAWFTLLPGPANDAFADAEEISGSLASVLASLSAATVEPGEAAGMPGGGSVWYRWTAPSDGWLRLRLPGAGSGVQVRIYEGRVLDQLTLRRTHQPTSPMDILDFEVRGGTPYLLAVHGPAGSQDSPLAMMFAAQAGPLLTLPKRRSDGRLEAWLSARPDTEYIIERSADLVQWQVVLRDRLGPWARLLELPAAGASSPVFYRSRRAP